VRKVLHTGWKLQAFKTQTLQDVRLRYAFDKDTMERMYEDKVFLERFAYNEGTPFHVRHNVTAWGSEQPHVFTHPDPVCLTQNTPVSMELQCRQPAALCECISVEKLHVFSRHNNLYNNIISICI